MARRGTIRAGNIGSGRQGTTTVYNFPHLWGARSNTSFSGGSPGYSSQNQAEKRAGYEAIRRGEERMSKDPTANLMDKAVSDIVSRSMEGKLDPLTQAEKDAAILKETEAAAQSAGQVVRHGAKALAGQGIGGTGYDAAGSMASLKSDTERNRQAALSAARVGIQTGAMREGRLAREAAGRLGTQLASARASSAQPFTLAESKARFGTNFPNV